MSSFRAGCLAPIGYYSYGALMLFLLMAPRILGRRWGMPLVAGAWSLAIVLTALALLLPLAYAAARLRRLEL
jgi:hypothetical protein